MFEKFGIKVYEEEEEDGDEEQPSGEVSSAEKKDVDNTLSPSHLYNEKSKLLTDFTAEYDNKNFILHDEDPIEIGSWPINGVATSNTAGGSTVFASEQSSQQDSMRSSNDQASGRSSKDKHDKSSKHGKDKTKTERNKSSKHEKHKHEKKKNRSPAASESSSTTKPAMLDTATYYNDLIIGQVSPVFIAEPGEPNDGFPPYHSGSATIMLTAGSDLAEESSTDDIFKTEDRNNIEMSLFEPVRVDNEKDTSDITVVSLNCLHKVLTLNFFFRQICKISPIHMSLSVSVSVC